MSNSDKTDRAYRMVLAKSGKSRPLERAAVRRKTERKGRGANVPEVMVKISSFRRNYGSLKAHLNYLSRSGSVPVFDAQDNNIEFGIENGGVNKLHDRAKEIARLDPRVQANKRLTCTLVLSMPPGTPKNAFADSVQSFAADSFDNHDYLYAFHDDTDAYHAHLIIPMLGIDGKRINPCKEDIARWREDFAQILEQNGVPANALPAPARGVCGKDKPFKRSKPFERGNSPLPEKSPPASLNPAAISQVLESWKLILNDAAASKDDKTVSAVQQFCLDNFGKFLPVSSRSAVLVDDKTR